eukprot:SM000004S15097  [mRNA]  locus=s4:1242861:1244315:+ [translate_table: standard]
MHVLAVHRRLHEYLQQQAASTWLKLHQPHAPERRVGILGLGELGTDAALKLSALGFDVSGWSRSGKAIPRVRTFTGPTELDAFLGGAEILVCLLPLTASTAGILDRTALDKLPRGAVLVNLARGDIVVEADLLDALASGQLSRALLDVFSTEPLPEGHPFWQHPRVVVLPHVAAYSDASCSGAWSAAMRTALNIQNLRLGLPLENVVDCHRGY